ncbi:MAG: hypothetical protein ABIJ16_10350 [Bacteroidota bacterium]
MLCVVSMLVSACGGNGEKKADEKAVVTKYGKCGRMTRYEVTESFCARMNLPVTAFSLYYPEIMITDPPEEGKQNSHYNYFLLLDTNNIQTEAMSLGYCTVQRNTVLKDQLSIELLEDIKRIYEEWGFEFSEAFIGNETFDGKDYYQFHALGHINLPENELSGEYLVLSLIVEPPHDNMNGLFVIMLANQDSEIRTFGDFARKGCISDIWKSLEFPE